MANHCSNVHCGQSYANDANMFSLVFFIILWVKTGALVDVSAGLLTSGVEPVESVVWTASGLSEAELCGVASLLQALSARHQIHTRPSGASTAENERAFLLKNTVLNVANMFA